MARIGQRMAAAALFVRAGAFSFSLVLPLLGAATVTHTLSWGRALTLIGVAGAFHIFAYVLNDVVDLPIDRTQALRQHDPLVAGTIRPNAALAIALFQVPLAGAITWALHPQLRAYLALAAAFCLLAAYDLWGKRISAPLLMDLLQGGGWSALVLYGAYTTHAPPGRLTAVAGAFVVVFVLLINGVHGGLKDLSNDLSHGVVTTPTALNVRVTEKGVVLSRAFVTYGIGLQAALLVIALAPLVFGWLAYSQLESYVIGLVILLVFALALALVLLAVRTVASSQRAMQLGTAHIIVLFGLLIVELVPPQSLTLDAAIFLAYFAPLLWTFAPGR